MLTLLPARTPGWTLNTAISLLGLLFTLGGFIWLSARVKANLTNTIEGQHKINADLDKVEACIAAVEDQTRVLDNLAYPAGPAGFSAIYRSSASVQPHLGATDRSSQR